MPIDVRARKTQQEWTDLADKMVREGTRGWFEWCEWIFITGALLYLQDKYKSVVIALAADISLTLLLLYCTSYIAGKLMFYNFPHIKSPRAARWLTVILSLAISFSLYYFLKAVIVEVAAHKE